MQTQPTEDADKTRANDADSEERILLDLIRFLEKALCAASSSESYAPLANTIGSLVMDLHTVRMDRLDPHRYYSPLAVKGLEGEILKTGSTLSDCDPGDPCHACVAAGKGGR